MTDYIIIALVVILLAFAVRAGIKRLRGETSCCGGAAYKARVKKLRKTEAKRVFTVEGMHCRNCVNRVMEAVNSIDGYSVIVHLKKGEAIVSSAQAFDEEAVRDAITKVGYKVTGIR